MFIYTFICRSNVAKTHSGVQALVEPATDCSDMNKGEIRKKNKEGQRVKNATTFENECLIEDYNEDFDFQGNLKLFNKEVS